jgi:hypothetical protein
MRRDSVVALARCKPSTELSVAGPCRDAAITGRPRASGRAPRRSAASAKSALSIASWSMTVALTESPEADDVLVTP